MQRNVMETVMGAVVLVVAALFLIVAYTSSGVRGVSNGYNVMARFDRIDGISSGSDVRMSGIKVGTVSDEVLDPKTYLAELHMTIDGTIKLPTDSSAEIVSSGLLGEKFVALVPGGAPEMLGEGGLIRYTQSPVSLENMIGQLIFSNKPIKGEDEAAAAPKAN